MNREERCKHLAHVWLFTAGINPTTPDTSGGTVADSLASLLEATFIEATQDAVERFLLSNPPSGSGEYLTSSMDETTGSYDLGELQELLRKATG